MFGKPVESGSSLRAGVALLGDQLSQCLLKVNEMVVSRQTANTHALGGGVRIRSVPPPRRVSTRLRTKKKKETKKTHVGVFHRSIQFQASFNLTNARPYEYEGTVYI